MSSLKRLALTSFTLITAHLTIAVIMKFSNPPPALMATLATLPFATSQSTYNGNSQYGTDTSNSSLSWHAPAKTKINSLDSAINGTGIYNFIFNSSQSPPGTEYNWCNMPHTNPSTYVTPPSDYKLEYVEVIHRHHKRTPYADNTFPREGYPWNCDDEGLFYGGKPINPAGDDSADTYWSVYTSPNNPFAPEGFEGTCQFPQITRGGLEDSHQHGADLKAVYADLLSFIPSDYDAATTHFRVTNNVITSQVASMLIPGLYPGLASTDVPLRIQPESIDSLEPSYGCDYADALFASYGPGSSESGWLAHIDAAAPLKRTLDAISGVDPEDEDWSKSYDHYFDSLSARLCHSKPLPCSLTNDTNCVTQAEADQVFRLGEYEYSLIYRDNPLSLAASTASFGVWIAELAANLRAAMEKNQEERSAVKYRHNVAHDGSVSRLLSILQLDRMVWPGMGAEVVFELYSKKQQQEEEEEEEEEGEGGCYFLRVLWGGKVLVSSHPAFGEMDVLPVETVLSYFDGLVGVGAGKVPGLCRQGV